MRSNQNARFPDQLEAIVRLSRELPPAKYGPEWIGTDASLAFLTAVALGPWKLARRLKVIQAAHLWLARQEVQDLAHVDLMTAQKVYPLAWQNKFLTRMILSLTDVETFAELCQRWRAEGVGPAGAAAVQRDILKRCGVDPQGGRGKCLHLFARDFLRIWSFPIDRHVRRTLKENGLPVDPEAMVRLCIAACVNPNDLCRRIFSLGGKNEQ